MITVEIPTWLILLVPPIVGVSWVGLYAFYRATHLRGFREGGDFVLKKLRG